MMMGGKDCGSPESRILLKIMTYDKKAKSSAILLSTKNSVDQYQLGRGSSVLAQVYNLLVSRASKTNFMSVAPPARQVTPPGSESNNNQ